MINYEPELPGLLDPPPEWPIHILYMELIGFVLLLRQKICETDIL